MGQSYRTDLTDEQWELLSKLIPPAKLGGRSHSVDIRAVINGIFGSAKDVKIEERITLN